MTLHVRANMCWRRANGANNIENRPRGGFCFDTAWSYLRAQVDIVKKLVRCIKTNDTSRFEDLINQAVVHNPVVVNYMFFAMKLGKSPALITGKMDSFAARLKKFESIVNDARRQINSNNIIAEKSQRGL